MTPHPLPPFWFIFDVESIGLHGEAFAVAAQIFDHNANPISSGWCHSVNPDNVRGTRDDRTWVQANVPTIVWHYKTMQEVREHFWDAMEDALKRHDGMVVAAECAWPVEAKFLLECVADRPQERNWNKIYPLHDIASIMLVAGMDPMATYARVHEDVEMYPPHHPLGDVKHSAWCLRAALQRLRNPAPLP